MYADRSEEEQTYFGTITQFDHALGRLLKYLDDNDLSNNTLIVFSSDNGPELMAGTLLPDGKVAPWGKTSRGSTLFRDRKHDIYDGGIKVPGIIRWPGVVKPDTVSHVPISTIDMLPTLCAVANAPLPENILLDGGDFRPAFEGKQVDRPHALYWQFNFSKSHTVWGVQSPDLAIRDKQWKLMCDFGFKNVELYNLDIDPGERWNFVKGRPEVASRLLEELKAIYESVNKPYPHERYLNQQIVERIKKQQKK
jgi:arylsulfatase